MKLGGKAKPKPIDQKVSADIAKWGERKGELLESEEAQVDDPEEKKRAKKSSAGDVHIINAPMPPVSVTASAPRDTSVLSTASACGTKCLLCRRQFASPELLHRHERESKLHAENLAKAAKAKASAPPSSGQSYRDRASERRAIYGQSAVPDDVVEGSNGRRRRSGSTELSYPVTAAAGASGSSLDSAPVAVSQDAANPGNQLLRRMGWNEGKGLGKDGSGLTEAIAVDSRAPQSKEGVGSDKASEIPPLNYADDVAYKNSLMLATRARFERVSGEKKEM